MKKILLIALLGLFSFSNAQIADGSVAPNFNVADIDGNMHDLQSYLNAGKTVILNISATWCGPCWNYKQTGALSDTFYAFGPEGSDEVVILYVEGDASTGLNELNGISGNTVGDWVSSTPFPIIDNAQIASDYQISYYPTVYRICPSGLVYEMGQLDANSIVSDLNTNCSSNLQGVSNHAMASVEDIVLCDDGVSADISINVKNYGNNTLTAFDGDVMSGTNATNVSQSLNNLQLYQSQDLVVNTLLDSNLAHSVDVNNLNGSAPHVSSLNSSDFNVSSPNATQNTSILVEVSTDNYPSEITWAILDENGAVITSGGPYQPGTDDQWGGGGPDAQTTFSYNVTLPSTTQCFSVELYDSFGDGWSLYNSTLITPGVEVFSGGNLLFSTGAPGDFGNTLAFPGAFKFSNPLNVNEFDAIEFNFYPNPSRGLVNFNSALPFAVEVIDLNGRVVFNGDVEANGQINLSSLNSGVYIVKATHEGSTRVNKLILK